MIKTWQQRCKERPDHEGIVTEQMIRDRMQEEIDELRQALAKPEIEPKVLVDMAVLAEREACAKVCENMERNGAWITKTEAAAAIRARGEK